MHTNTYTGPRLNGVAKLGTKARIQKDEEFHRHRKTTFQHDLAHQKGSEPKRHILRMDPQTKPEPGHRTGHDEPHV